MQFGDAMTLPSQVVLSSSKKTALLEGRWRTADVLGSAGSFNKLALPFPLRRALALAGFKTPSPVQESAIPLARLGSDLVVQAKSGTGKTLVFAVACLERIDVSCGVPQALVVCPTRELAHQIASEIARLSHNLPPPPATCGVFIGGVPVAADLRTLRRNCQVVVGTPGRLAWLVQARHLATKGIRVVVLDEVDQLFTQSMQRDVEFLLNNVPQEKQFLAFSATYTSEVLAQVESRMHVPQRILVSGTCSNLIGVRQCYKLCRDVNRDKRGEHIFEAKVDALIDLFNTVSFHQALVFCNEQGGAAKLAGKLTRQGFPAEFISGLKAQDEREGTMKAMRGFQLRVIVSTDLMARGVDLDKVNLVCNLDLPVDCATYQHRLGRTGRFGTLGLGVSFVTESELFVLKEFVKLSAGNIEPLPDNIPEDWYSYELKVEEDKAAYGKLLNAPSTAEPLRHFSTTKDSGISGSEGVGLLDFWRSFMGKRTKFWNLWDPYNSSSQQKNSMSQSSSALSDVKQQYSKHCDATLKEEISAKRNNPFSSSAVVCSEQGIISQNTLKEDLRSPRDADLRVVWENEEEPSTNPQCDLESKEDNNIEKSLDQALRASRYDYLCAPKSTPSSSASCESHDAREVSADSRQPFVPKCGTTSKDVQEGTSGVSHQKLSREGTQSVSDSEYSTWLKAYNSWGRAYAQWYHDHQEWLVLHQAWCTQVHESQQ